MKRAIVVLLVLIAAIRLWIAADLAFPGDGWAAHFIEVRGPYDHGLLADGIDDFRRLGRPKGAALVVLVAVALAWWLAGRRAAAVIAASIGVVVLNDAIKLISGPTAPFSIALGHRPHEYNWPSGHAAYAAAVFGAIAVVCARRRFWPGVVLAALVIALMGPARVLGGYHLVSDVVAGYLVGAAWLLVVLVLERQWATRRLSRAARPA